MENLTLRAKQLSRSFTFPRATPPESTSPLPQLSQLSLADDPAKLPCVVLPSIRTSRFFDRDDLIREIERHFGESPPGTSFVSPALHGLGEVGKSTVALKYAEKQLRRGELDGLFWVHSEKLVSIRQNFTDIAFRLRLPDARRGDHNENRELF
ncbi:hypothetical protein B0T18DRAFT_236139 [Schizothecium vesticola]|uniref:NB-ARC domain-containing protein n=1 Tax=Schizothecium vesticola TaxID=314040 RepID=A0AA40BP68_9PEZI|nr:hypothetical protein B0T18DRAFT_236139 [Schizothecium vesticola]